MYKVTVSIYTKKDVLRSKEADEAVIEDRVSSVLAEIFGMAQVERVSVFDMPGSDVNIVLIINIPYTGEENVDILSLAVEGNISNVLVDIFGTVVVEDVFSVNTLSTELISSTTVSIRISETPLTAQNVITIISALTELHTKCWLIQQGRFTDVINYIQTHNPLIGEEVPLTIGKMTRSSPALIELIPKWAENIHPERLAEALKIAVMSVVQLNKAKRDQQLKEKEVESALADKELDRQIKLREAESVLADKEMERQIKVEKAEIARQKELLELEKLRFALEQKRLDYALKTARVMVDTVRPDADDGTKALLLQTLLPNLLQLGNSKGLELALTEPHTSDEEYPPTEGD